MSSVVFFEVGDDIVAFGHAVDAVVFVDKHRHASLAAYLLDFRCARSANVGLHGTRIRGRVRRVWS